MELAPGEEPFNNPLRRIAGCCALTATGAATVTLPRRQMKSRRRIICPILGGTPIADFNSGYQIRKLRPTE
jgi:hypothetical protein